MKSLRLSSILKNQKLAADHCYAIGFVYLPAKKRRRRPPAVPGSTCLMFSPRNPLERNRSGGSLQSTRLLCSVLQGATCHPFLCQSICVTWIDHWTCRAAQTRHWVGLSFFPDFPNLHEDGKYPHIYVTVLMVILNT